jgi:hypothetical protein
MPEPVLGSPPPPKGEVMIQIDSEFQALIPPLTPDERQQLEANLKAEGCRDPLVVWNGLLLDGHHRFQICTAARLPYTTVEQPCADRDAAKIWIIQHQFGRRNLNMAQRAELAMQLEPLLAAQAAARQWNGGNGEPLGSIDPKGKTTEQLAVIAGISGPSMSRAVAVFKRGTPELQDAMRSGKVKVSAAYDRLKAGEAVAPAPRKSPLPYTHKIRKERDVPTRLQQLLQEFRQKRKDNHDNIKASKWIPHGISVLAQKEIMDWLDQSLEELIQHVQALMPSASGSPVTHKPRLSTSNEDDNNGSQKTTGSTH